MKFTNVPCGFLFHDRPYRPGETIQGEVYIGLTPDVLAWSRIDIALVGVSIVAIRNRKDPFLFSESSARLMFRHALLTHGGISSSPSTKFPFSIQLPSYGDAGLSDRVFNPSTIFRDAGPDQPLPPTFEADHEQELMDGFAVSVRYELVVRATGIGFFKAPVQFGPRPASLGRLDDGFRMNTIQQRIQSQALLQAGQRPRGASGLLKSTFKQTPAGTIHLTVQTPTHAYAGHVLQLHVQASLQSDTSVGIAGILPPLSVDGIYVAIKCKTSVRASNSSGWSTSHSEIVLYDEVLFQNARATMLLGMRVRTENRTEEVPFLNMENNYQTTVFTRPLSAGFIHPPFATSNVSRSYTLIVKVRASCEDCTMMKEWVNPLVYETAEAERDSSSTSQRAASTLEAPAEMQPPTITQSPAVAPPPAYTSAPSSPTEERPSYLDTLSLSELDDFFDHVLEDSKPQSDKWRYSPRIMRRMVQKEILGQIRYHSSGGNGSAITVSMAGASAVSAAGNFAASMNAGGGGGGGGG